MVEDSLGRYHYYWQKISGLKSVIPEFTTGAVVGIITKEATKRGLSLLGVSNIPLAIAVGAVGGGSIAITREYIRQRKSISLAHSEKSEGNWFSYLTSGDLFRDEVAWFTLMDKEKLLKSGGKGVLAGALGAAVGWYATDLIKYIDWQQLAFVNQRGEVPIIPTSIPKPTSTAELTKNFLKPTQIPTPIPYFIPTPYPTQITEAIIPTTTPVPISPPPLDTTIPTVNLPIVAVEAPSPPLPPITPEIVPPAPKKLLSIQQHISLHKGSSPWEEVKNYLEQNINRPPTNLEVAEATNKVMADSGIVDAANLPPGTVLDFSAINNQYLVQVINAPTESLLTETISLPSGSSAWIEVASYLKTTLGREPTNEEILIICKEALRQSGISEDTWGIRGTVAANRLPNGFKLVFNKNVKELISQMARH